MSEVLDLYHGDLKIGAIGYDEAMDTYSVSLDTQLTRRDVPVWFWTVYPNSVPEELVRRFVLDRTVPSRRHNIDEMLEYAGLKTYTTWGMFKAANGTCSRDFFHVKARPEE
jgi:hypothetical protein